jgi:hypothetical protein
MGITQNIHLFDEYSSEGKEMREELREKNEEG